MKTYRNLSGNSGVAAYEIGKTFIKIKFSGESGIYIYKIIYKDAFGKGHSETGHVNLVR